MDFIERELEIIGDERFTTPRTFRSTGSKAHSNSHRGSVKSSGSTKSDEYKTVHSSGRIYEREESFHTAISGQSFASRNNTLLPRDGQPKRAPTLNHPEAFLEEDDEPDSQFTDVEVSDIFSYARHGRCDDIAALLSRGIPVDVRDEVGNTILIVACQNGNKRVAKLALRNGANINVKNYKGNTPLHFCYHFGYDEIM
jgi:hypothetical protein